MEIKILALDQATKVTGYSIWNGNHLSIYGALHIDDKIKNPIERMKLMYEKIEKLIEQYNPNFVVFENVQFQNNYGTFQQLSQLQGVIMSYLFKKDIGFHIIEPSAWKGFCKIKGRKREEQKKNTRNYIESKYNIEVSEDEADAIGIGLWAIANIKIKEQKENR